MKEDVLVPRRKKLPPHQTPTIGDALSLQEVKMPLASCWVGEPCVGGGALPSEHTYQHCRYLSCGLLGETVPDFLGRSEAL